tara:strand:+ start:168 stop:446 length:279 start_codon:yes stop_codon:yes gene_type:complete
MSKYDDEFIDLLVREKENMSLTQIAAKYNLTHGQVTYVIYKLSAIKDLLKGHESVVDTLYPKSKIYKELQKASDELQKKNSFISKLIKLLTR